MKKILIDGLYQNNIRVALLNDNELEDFEFETSEKESTRGNIYLAKVSRVENSLQAAFVDYGGEKNGFLSFAEIHPDYFQIPKEDKDRFMREISSLNEKDEDDNTRGMESKLISLYKSYNIGEVIKKDQLLLVQVVKEERGNKGVSLTTYLSFPGRYFVLMTNTPKKIGISKKISDVQERGRIREIVGSFGLAKSSGIVVRTAAEGKNRDELLKDYNYLASLWNNVREKTVKSEAPAFIHSEESITKKVLRDYCDPNVKEIVVEGEEVFNEVSSFAKSLGYESSIKIINHIGKTPIFTKYNVENQITSLLLPKVEMPSGAYLIIQQTEALVSIDVNSGKVTSANNIEETAVQTNLEAAKEIAKQLKLRKLAGLIVIDFIDMMKVSNRILIENEVKQHLMKDKARVHIGRISQFGLLELSRQRTDQSMFEASGVVCYSCGGSGFVKSPEYTAMNVMRGIASQLLSSKAKFGKYTAIYLQDGTLVHIMNFKRKLINLLEKRYNTKFIFYIDNNLKTEGFRIEHYHSTEFGGEDNSYSKSLTTEIKEEVKEIKKKKSLLDKIFGRRA
jgi:ribonuclease E